MFGKGFKKIPPSRKNLWTTNRLSKPPPVRLCACGETGMVQLTHGRTFGRNHHPIKTAVIDADQVERVAVFSWHYGRKDGTVQAEVDWQMMVRANLSSFVTRSTKHFQHKNGDPFDCRLANLVVARGGRPNTSGYRGVWWHSGTRYWKASMGESVGRCKKTIPLGSFDTAEDAARAYDHAAWRRWGERAELNFLYDGVPPPPQNRRSKLAKSRRRTANKYRGVSFHKQTGRWTARIGSTEKRKYLGLYATEEAAARAYDRAAREMYGPNAALNFP